jgi:hypothetical protein
MLVYDLRPQHPLFGFVLAGRGDVPLDFIELGSLEIDHGLLLGGFDFLRTRDQ